MPRIRLLCHKLSICLKFIGNWEAVFQSSWTIYTLTSNEPCFISSSAFGTVSFVSLDRQRGGDFFGRNDAKAETPVLWPPHAKSWFIGKDSDAGRDWGQGGEGDDRGWDGWMISRTRWMWVWVNSGRWWWTGRTGVLWFMRSQRVGHDWATELNWTERGG